MAERIAAGDWRPGSSLPNEQDLAREFGTSAGTIRKALDKLEAERVVQRRQGRGTFVSDQTVGDLATRFCNIRNEQGERVVGASELIEQTEAIANDHEQERLRLDAGERVVRSRRLHHYRGRPFMYEDARLAIGRFPGLQANSAGDYRISSLAQKHGVHLARAFEKVDLVLATPEISDLLRLEPGTALLRIDRLMYAMNERLVEWRVGICHMNYTLYYSAEIA